jgi:NADH dehydrogenase FAD-containing subunit
MRHTIVGGPRARVVIVGAGFGGLGCGRRLNRAEVDVLLLDKGGYHLFTPLLYQVATALLNQAGRYIARAIRSDLRGDETGPRFRYIDKGRMATIGRNAAVAQLRGGLELTGFAGWLAWLFVHIWYLAGLRNRVIALASSGWYYLLLDRPLRIILQTPPDPIVATLRGPDPDKRHAAPAQIGRRSL